MNSLSSSPLATVGGVSLEEIAETFGTPLFVYDAEVVRRRIGALRAALPERVRPYYSAKANAAVAIARLMRIAGLGLDACSPGDLELARRAGFAGDDVSYTGFGATGDELRAAAEHGATIVVDGFDEIERAGGITGIEAIGLRVNPEIEAGFHDHVVAGASHAKFGIPYGELEHARELAQRHGLHVAGLHAHLGSDILDPAAHMELLGLLADVAAAWGDLGWINLGGGFGTRWSESDVEYDWAQLAGAMEHALESIGSPSPELRIEPGGHLLMDAGLLLTRVVSVRPPSAARKATAAVDASTNHLLGALLFSGDRPVFTSGDGSGAHESWRIAGQLMQAADVLVEAIDVPGGLRAGQLIALGNAGAYASARAGTFNERPRAAEVMVDEGEARLIRRAEEVSDLFARDLP